MTNAEQMTYDYKMKWLGELKSILFDNIDTENYAIFLFGSAVNNIVKAHDFDIGVLGNNELPYEIKRDINYVIDESVIPLQVDIVDFKKVGGDFKKIALSEIEIWNKPQNIILN